MREELTADQLPLHTTCKNVSAAKKFFALVLQVPFLGVNSFIFLNAKIVLILIDRSLLAKGRDNASLSSEVFFDVQSAPAMGNTVCSLVRTKS